MYRIALVEDNFELRQSLRSFFEDSKKIALEFDTDSIEKFIKFYRTAALPQLVLLDVNLPGANGIEALPRIRRQMPAAEIVIYTVLDDSDRIFQAICNGASGYLLKSTPPKELERLLLTAIEEQGALLSPSVARRIVLYFQNGMRVSAKGFSELNATESAIVRLLADALKYQEIADKIGMSIDGVRYHIKHIYAKLQVRSRSELLRRWDDRLKP